MTEDDWSWRAQQELEEREQWEAIEKEMAKLMLENPDDDPLELVFQVQMTETQRTQWILDNDPEYLEWLESFENENRRREWLTSDL